MWTNGFQVSGGGSGFPTQPTVNDIYFRTDLHSLYQYTGAAFTAGPSGGWIPIGGPPLGAIEAWHKDLVSGGMPTPAGWIVCDGTNVSDSESPFNGLATPNLNNANFIKGGSSSSPTQIGSNMPTHTHSIPDHMHLIADASGTTTMTAVAARGPTAGAFGSGYHTGSARNTNGLSLPPSGSPDTGTNGTANNYPAHMVMVWIIRIK